MGMFLTQYCPSYMQLQMVEAERDLLRRQREESLVQNMSLADDLNRARAQASQVRAVFLIWSH